VQERIEDLLALSPEAILLRWVNHQLQCAGVTRRCANFQQDVADSEIYSHLLKQIAPDDAHVTLDALRVSLPPLWGPLLFLKLEDLLILSYILKCSGTDGVSLPTNK
jgi:hypothetical protein